MIRMSAALLLMVAGIVGARAEVSEIRITRLPGIIYLGAIVMERQHLVEAASAALGQPRLTARYITFASGGTATDALLSGNVEIVTTGPSNLLLLWDRTKGQVKGLAAAAATSLWFISADPSVKTLRDLTARDRIAVPTAAVSSQAIILQIAARQLYGDADFAHFDRMEVTMGHPDASAALLHAAGGLTAHFSGPPFQEQEARAPGLHVVTTSDEILGRPYSNSVYFASTRFHDANPMVTQAFMEAARQASVYISEHPREACELYAAATGDRTPVDALLSQMGDPSVTYSVAPTGMMLAANHMADTKILRSRPADWREFFFPEASELPGN